MSSIENRHPAFRSGICAAQLSLDWQTDSNWVLDLIVYRVDKPILSGNFGSLPMLGFGLRRFPVLATTLEALLVLFGAMLHWRTARLIATCELVTLGLDVSSR